MRTRWALVAAATVAATAALVATAGAVPHRAKPVQPAPTQRLHLNTLKQIKHYLRSIGVNPARVTIQRGIRNYAGPKCPGRGWNCTRARQVVQLAASGAGANAFQCSPSSSPGPTKCDVVQISTASPPVNQSASCGISSNAATADLECNITQQNNGGNNDAAAALNQSGSDAQTQSGSQTVRINQQTTGSGANRAAVGESIVQSATIGGSTVSQSQTSNLFYDVDQKTDTGTNDFVAAQNASLTEKASAAKTGSQYQKNDETGHIDQFSHGVSKSQNQQYETLSQDAKGSGVAQTQIGPVGCCSSSADNPNNTTTITQNSQATQTPGTGGNDTQTDQQVATYTSTGNVSANQSMTQDGTTTSNSASGSTVAIQEGCTSDSCNTAPPPTLSINDVSQAEGNSGTTNFVFTVTASAASSVPMSADYSTADGTATAGSDYQATSGTVTFNPGETTKTITVPVNGDTTFEPDETFFVNLSNPSGASIADPQGQGTIQNDDSAAVAANQLFVSVGNGQVQQWDIGGVSPTYVRTLDDGSGSAETTGLGFDGSNNLLVTDWTASSLSKYYPQTDSLAVFVTGFDAHPESVAVDSSGNIYVGLADGTKRIMKLDPNGIQLQTYGAATESRGTDWIAFRPGDDCHLFYTSEGTDLLEYDVCQGQQLPNVAPLPGPTAYAVAVRSNGEILVADTNQIVRVNASGNVIQSYNVPSESHLWFSLALDTSNTAFWVGDPQTGDVVEFDIATGGVLKRFNTNSASQPPTSFNDAGGIAVRNVAPPVIG